MVNVLLAQVNDCINSNFPGSIGFGRIYIVKKITIYSLIFLTAIHQIQLLYKLDNNGVRKKWQDRYEDKVRRRRFGLSEHVFISLM